MSLKSCLDNAVAAGELSADEAREMDRLYASFSTRRKADGAPDADLQAKEDLSRRLRADAAEMRRRTLLAAKRHREIEKLVADHRDTRGNANIGSAALALLDHQGTAKFSSVHGRQQAIISSAQGMMATIMQRFERTRITGQTPRIDDLVQIVRETFGEDTGNPTAKGMAKAWADTSDYLRERFNRAGGAIGKLENWGMPQSHSRLALLNAGLETWKKNIRGRLDVGKMRHPLTGDPVMDSELDGLLDDIFETIVTDGDSKRTASRAVTGRGALAGQRAEHRFLTFKSADDWIAYQADFGQGNPFATMMDHISMMARDIAALEVLGPNPNATLTWLDQMIEIDGSRRVARGEKGARSKANLQRMQLQNTWLQARGASEMPGHEGWANALANTRNVVTAAKMGGAIIPAMATDPMLQVIGRQIAGLPVMGYARDAVAALGKEGRQDAIAMGFVIESAMSTFRTQARYMGTLEGGAQWSRYMADRVIALSGLAPWTHLQKRIFFMGFTRELAVQRGKDFAGLPANFRRTFERYGLDARAWETIRQTELFEPRKGAQFISPNDVGKADPELRDRLVEMIMQETLYSVPEATLGSRAALIGSSRPGTFGGEFARSFAMFKGFPVAQLFLNIPRLFQISQGSKWNGVGFAGAVLATSTLSGALALWMRDIRDGKDPRPIDGGDGNVLPFAGAAMLQGGGMGIFGDFLFADLNRFGGGLETTLAGPVVQEGTALLNLTLGNLIQLANGEDTKFWQEANRFVGSNLPGATLWYTRLAYQRLILDQLQRAADPDANRKFKQKQRRQLKEYGTGYWWRPGRTSPDRAPAFGTGR